MKAVSIRQWILIAAAIIITVLLYYAPKTTKTDDKSAIKPMTTESKLVDLDKYSDSITKLLEPNLLLLFKQESALINGKDAAKANDSIAGIVLLKSIAAASVYKERSAKVSNTSIGWTNAGESYYKATRFEKPYLRFSLFQKAILCLNRSLQIDSTDLKTMTLLGTCYVEGSQQPMNGIMMLRKVVGKDSSYVDAQIQLGLFAVQSGQYDKAIDRFNKILRIKPSFIEAYIYLGQTYADMGKKTDAISALQKYRSLSNDNTINQQVDKFISELKNN